MLVVCITKKLQVMLCSGFLDTGTTHTVARMTANLKGSEVFVLPSSMPVLQTGGREVCLA